MKRDARRRLNGNVTNSRRPIDCDIHRRRRPAAGIKTGLGAGRFNGPAVRSSLAAACQSVITSVSASTKPKTGPRCPQCCSVCASDFGLRSPELSMGWVNPWVGLGWIGSHKMDPWTTLPKSHAVPDKTGNT